MMTGKLVISSRNHMELLDVTDLIANQVAVSNITNGICHLHNPHTTAGLTINEGADPAVKDDIIVGLQKIVPMSYPFKHLEGNSPSHIMASLMGCSLTVFVEDSRLLLGTWQRIFFCEFDGPRTRSLYWRITAHN